MGRFIFRLVRYVVGNIIVFLSACFPPHPITRSHQDQKNMDARAKTMTLYQFHLCPFCVKVRRMIHQMHVTIEMRDVKKHEAFEKELIKGGGKRKVPCLRIKSEGKDEWLVMLGV